MSDLAHAAALAASNGWKTSRWPGFVWSALLTLVILAPTLAPGYLLVNDMVFTPNQTLLPWNLGIGGGLPRSVPQDAVVSLIAGPLTGQVLQKLVLLLMLLLAGLGVDRLVRDRTLLVRFAAITLVIWNPYVAERLIQGHWALLLAYATLPWALRAAIDLRAGRPGAMPRLILWSALASLVPTGGLLVVSVVVGPIVIPGAIARLRLRLATLAALVLINAAWWLPSILNTAVDQSDPAGARGFALASEGWWGSAVTALGLGGIWNSDAWPASRAFPWIPLVSLILVALAIAGIASLIRLLGRAAAWWLVGVSVAGLVVAVAGSWGVTAGAVQWIVTDVPGGGLLRDGQKLLAPLALLIALAAPLGLNRLVARLSSVDGRRFVLLLLLVVPLLVMPDLAWGAFGRLHPVNYPPSWNSVRSAIAHGPSGDAISIPWSTFRRYSWNNNRTVLDPAPRFMTRTVITDGRLPIQHGDFIIYVAGDDPRSAAVSAALYSPKPLTETLPALGVRYVIDQTDQPPMSYDNSLVAHLDGLTDQERKFAGMVKVYSGDGLTLWQTPTAVATVEAPGWAWLVVLVDVLVVALLLVSAGALIVQSCRGKFRHATG